MMRWKGGGSSHADAIAAPLLDKNTLTVNVMPSMLN